MTARVIDGKAVAAGVRERVATGVAELAGQRGGEVLGLATVLVGDDPPSAVYVASKRKLTEEVGMRSIHHQLGAATPQEELLDLVGSLNAEETVDGILVQLPLPDQALTDENGRPGVIHKSNQHGGASKWIYCWLADRVAGLSPTCEPKKNDHA